MRRTYMERLKKPSVTKSLCKATIILCGLFFMSGAHANAKLDCLDDLFELGLQSNLNVLVVPQGPVVANDPSEEATVAAELSPLP